MAAPLLQLVSLLSTYSTVPIDSNLAPLLPINTTTSVGYRSDAIDAIAQAICRQEAHVIRFFRRPTRNAATILTEQLLLHALNNDCEPAAVVQILAETELRSTFRYHQEMSVFVLVLGRMADFQPHIFDTRMGAKQFQRYFVVIEAPIPVGRWLRDMFRVFWLKQVLNVVVIFNDGLGEAPRWFTYSPFGDVNDGVVAADNGHNGTSMWHVPLLHESAANGGDEQLRTIETNSTAGDWFANRLGNVHRSRLTVSMHPDEVRAIARPNFEVNGFDGVDGRVADLIRERMNATFVYTGPTCEFTGSNKTGILGDLYYRLTNFGFNAISHVSALLDGVVETSNSFERHDICVLVPNSAAEPTLYNLLRTMTPDTWAIVIASVGVAIVAYKAVQTAQLWLLARCHPPAREQSICSWPETLSIHFQSFFGDSISSLPTSVPMRVMTWCWCLYSFLITSAFTAKLISSLVLPRYLDNIDTLQELSASPLNVIYPSVLNDTLWRFLSADSDATLITQLRDQMRPVPTERIATMLGTERTGNAYVLRNYMAKYVRRKFFDVTAGRSYYHLMHECTVYLPKVYLMEKGSAYAGHVNELLGRFNEMGFMVRWDEETMHRFSLRSRQVVDDVGGVAGDDGVDSESEEQVAEEDIKVVITVTHLQTAFYLLFVGLALGVLAFGAELWWARRQRRRTLYRVVYFDKQLAREYGCRVDG